MGDGRLKLAVLDFDGTLVDSQHLIVTAMTDAMAAEGLTCPEAAAIRRVIGLPLVGAVSRLLPAAEPHVHERLAVRYRDAFRALRARPDHQAEPLMPGARDALAALDAAGFLLAIATGKGRRSLLHALELHGLASRFVALQTADDAPGKPDPGMLLNAMALAGTTADRTVMIGDTSYDIAMALAAGAAAIGVGWGYHPADELAAAGAHGIAARFAEVPEMAQSLLLAREAA